MSIITKLALALLAGVLLFGAGFYTRGEQVRTVQAPPIIRTETQTVVQEKVVTKVVREKVSAPDGTTTTKTTTETEAVSEKKADKQQPVPVASVPANLPNWSVAVTWTPRLEEDVYKPTGMELSRRLGSTNAWAVGAFDWRTHTATAGLRVEF